MVYPRLLFCLIQQDTPFPNFSPYTRNEHSSFGHGQQHLASLLVTLNILSFLFHTVLDLLDQKYKLLRAHLPTRKTFFEDLRALTRYMYFDSWDHLLTFMLQGLELEIPPNSN